MTLTITAIVDAGLLRPESPLNLAEGTRVALIVIQEDLRNSQHGRSPAGILAEIAALPTAPGDPKTSQHHDQVLYHQQDS